ncbi:polyphosphate kinase 2 family protein [Vineibacter terrae]|uniref:Polyphosphate kinase 2 family protein n=1 Tax=Vineibacter terrae TaxID=2586908 RepID=A0A5C8PUG8_9HYPH|nr:polyphosphate kinase 2 family protein [Vineibacter terrae]TXL81549.1 polyphosphate kinase 2 family protein [Vineibacter terrae]
MNLAEFVRRFRVADPQHFRLADRDPGDTSGLDINKKEGKDLLEEGIKRLADLQERLYAQQRHAVLAIFQAMDAAGKDSAIKHVMSGVNPQGCDVHSFKAPTEEELRHDFLWRTTLRLPDRGRIGIFNRSYYEEVLVVRVHPEMLARQRLPGNPAGEEALWQERFEDIRAFERHLARSGTIILKFHLQLSRKEQKKRFLERIDTPSKNWKFSMGDIAERKLWDAYMAAYEDMIRNTSTPEAPWYVVPADAKWFTRLIVAGALVEALERLGPAYPTLDDAARGQLAKAREELLKEDEA